MNLGAHMSIAGGLHLAFNHAVAAGCGVLQIFTKSSNQWRAKPLTDDDVARFEEARRRTGIRRVVAHDSYLINLASPDPALWKKSLDAFLVELERAERLGLDGLVFHPGAHMGAGEEAGLGRVAKALDAAHTRCRGYRCRTLIETTAGQGTSLGWRFEHLAGLLDRVRDPARVGVCLDTCHVFAAGYDLRTPSAYRATMRAFDRIVGLERIQAFHVNDSKRELGSRVDRHAHIGAGMIGLEGFRCLMNDRRFRRVPMILETEKEGDMDRANLAALRGLRRSRAAPRKRAARVRRGSAAGA